MDLLNDFKQYLETSFAVNERVVIEMATNIARDLLQYANDVCSIIKARIEYAPLNQKLNLLYLIDSIIKSIGGAYMKLFAEDITEIFMSLYKDKNVA